MLSFGTERLARMPSLMNRDQFLSMPDQRGTPACTLLVGFVRRSCSLDFSSSLFRRYVRASQSMLNAMRDRRNHVEKTGAPRNSGILFFNPHLFFMDSLRLLVVAAASCQPNIRSSAGAHDFIRPLRLQVLVSCRVLMKSTTAED
jgi:hypothetical protein